MEISTCYYLRQMPINNLSKMRKWLTKGMLISNQEKLLMCPTRSSKSTIPRLFQRSLLSSLRVVVSPLRAISNSFKYRELVLYLKLNKYWVLLQSIVHILAVVYNLPKKLLPLKFFPKFFLGASNLLQQNYQRSCKKKKSKNQNLSLSKLRYI